MAMTEKEKQEIIDRATKQLSGGNWLTGPGGLSTDVGQIESGINRAVGGFAPGVTVADPTTTAPKKKAPAKAAAPSGPTALQAQQYAIANSPWTQASQALAGSLNTDLQALSGLASGTALGAVDQNTDKMAGALTGTPTTSGAGQWLAAQSAAANAATAPVAAAMQGEQNAFTTGESPFAQALLNMGNANALAVETAPQAGWYNALCNSRRLEPQLLRGGPRGRQVGVPE